MNQFKDRDFLKIPGPFLVRLLCYANTGKDPGRLNAYPIGPDMRAFLQGDLAAVVTECPHELVVCAGLIGSFIHRHMPSQSVRDPRGWMRAGGLQAFGRSLELDPKTGSAL